MHLPALTLKEYPTSLCFQTLHALTVLFVSLALVYNSQFALRLNICVHCFIAWFVIM